MEQVEATLSNANQITISKELRKLLDVEAGDKVIFRLDGCKVFVQKAETRAEAMQRVTAELDQIRADAEANLTPEQKEFSQQSAGWTINQYHEYFDNAPEQKAYIKEKYGL